MIKRELRILTLQKGALLGALGFFALVLFASGLALGPDPKILERSAPALIWILAILTTLFSTPYLLKQEAQEGHLDQLILQPSPPALSLLAKVSAEFICLGLPLIFTSVFLSPLFGMPINEIFCLSLSLLIGLPALSSLGLLGGLLIIHSRGGGILLSLLILPLTLPIVLFSLASLEMVRLGLDSFPSFGLLISASIVMTILSLTAGSKALQLAVEG